MKANELMIGDWVMYNPNVFIEDEYEPIRECLPTKINNGEDIDLAIEGCYTPIPLTPEILEKNGFERNPLWHHCDKDLDNYSISVQLGYANRIEYIKIAEKGKDNVIPSERTKLYLTHIKYVHQLQQALRLCCITREIIL